MKQVEFSKFELKCIKCSGSHWVVIGIRVWKDMAYVKFTCEECGAEEIFEVSGC